ncbi:MAG: pyridoxal-phosphate dependent enzyme [Acidimicrobiia bacterium]|nr:pyridoxal-phosphate dependent enzyme [Acidimicrobiia bacterium]
MQGTSWFQCVGCGASLDPDDAAPFRCPGADTGGAHVLARVLDVEQTEFRRRDSQNPFLRYRDLFHTYALARRCGLDDDGYAEMVDTLDRRVEVVDGRGFRITPTLEVDPPGGGTLWVKSEIDNVAGSHKARHLMGVMIHLQVIARLGLPGAPDPSTPLAIASCGNAALAAAVVARAADRTLEVFVPTWADRDIVSRLEDLGATVHACARDEGNRGDPCVTAFRTTVRRGAVPFSCQGPDNGLAIEGAKTIAWELLDALGSATLDRIMVQVGGGALASAVWSGLGEFAALGLLARPPRFHPVQAVGCAPFARAHERARRHLAEGATVDEVLAAAAASPSEYMWPWESEPASAATGILDDETYDWLVVLAGTLESGGTPVVVSEDLVGAAPALAEELTGLRPDPTGAAGFAGLLALRGGPDGGRGTAADVGPDPDLGHSAVLFTGGSPRH